MKLHFESDLDYQWAAIESVCDLFHGQEICQTVFTVMKVQHKEEQLKLPGVEQGLRVKQLALPGMENETGFGNRLTLLDDKILKNLRAVQLRNGLKPSTEEDLSGNFTVEMETGTGKTYVYVRTIFELNKRFGFTKFVIVVPTLAIKEGVYKTLEITEDHFKGLYNNVSFDFFLYDSNRLDRVRNFATSSTVQIMVVTVGSINKQDVNKLYDDSEKTGGERPIDLIRATRPIVIVDEPQSVDGGLKGRGKDALDKMNPLCTLRYSATHADKFNMVYRLDAVDAYERKLVKQIEVASLETQGAQNKAYVKLLSTQNKNGAFSAKIELDVLERTGMKRKMVTVKAGDNLELLTSRVEYAGLLVENICCKPGEQHIELSTLEKPLGLEQWIGDVEDDTMERIMIRRTIEEHLEKELRLNKQGIKVLSLFFINRVENYRKYADDGSELKSKYAEIFEEEYFQLASLPKYKGLFKNIDVKADVSEVHGGYFSIDKKKRWTDTSENTEDSRESAERAYNLIMKDKEKLLSFDTRLRFIFSHSALREGWDNPNVFQICTLRDVNTERERRQTLGRGLRLCVNQQGDRVRGEVNTLTVIATENYEEFAANLQREIEKDTGIRFGLVEKHQFAGIPTVDESGQIAPLGVEKSEAIWNYLKESGYVDAKCKIQNSLRSALKDGTFELPDEFKPELSQVQDILRKLAGKLDIKDADERKPVKTRQAILHSEEFQALWNRIRDKTTYRVAFDNEKLISECISAVSNCPAVSRTSVQIRKADVAIGRGGVSSQETSLSAPIFIDEMNLDLPDLLTELQDRTQLTRRSLVRILTESGRLKDFSRNPQQFIEFSADVINRTKRMALVDGIKYQRLGDEYFYAQELFEQEELTGYLKNMLSVEKSVHEFVVYDSAGIEHSFAEQLERNQAVKVYAKLPRWFKVPTPLGTYNPDWAVLVEVDGSERLYFVVETKGSIHSDDLRVKESGKIRCGETHFMAIAAAHENPARFIKATSISEVMSQIDSAGS